MQNMRLTVLILISTASFPSHSASFVNPDPSLFDTFGDQLSIPFGDTSYPTNTFDFASDQFYSADDPWNLPPDSPNLDFPLADASCSDHADESNLPLVAKLRSRASNSGAICAPDRTTKSEPDWQDGGSDVQTGIINLIPEFPILVFPDILRDGLSPTVCGKYTVVIMYPVCDSGQPIDRSTSLIYFNPNFPMYKLDNCHVCTFLRLLLFFFFYSNSSRFILALFRLPTPPHHCPLSLFITCPAYLSTFLLCDS